jgi:hypothetical protein
MRLPGIVLRSPIQIQLTPCLGFRKHQSMCTLPRKRRCNMAKMKRERLLIIMLAVAVGMLPFPVDLPNAWSAGHGVNQTLTGLRISSMGFSSPPMDRGLRKQSYLATSPALNLTCSGGCASRRSACQAACPSGAQLCPQACQRAYNYCMGKCVLKNYPR